MLYNHRTPAEAAAWYIELQDCNRTSDAIALAWDIEENASEEFFDAYVMAVELYFDPASLVAASEA